MRPRMVIPLSLLVVLGASGAGAVAEDFWPRSWENGAYFDLFGSYEQDHDERSTQPVNWNDSYLREKLTLYSDGFSYHPRFMQYHVSLAGALKQEEYDATFLPSQGWTHDSGVEYDTRFVFLPEHPYNFELFALRYEPLYKEQASMQHNSVETRRGLFFQYRKKPYLVHSRYSFDRTEQGVTWSEVNRLSFDAEYFKRYTNGNQFSLTGAYNPSRTDTSAGLEGSTTEALLGNVLDLRRVRLNSSVTQNDSTQDSPLSGSFDNNQFAWYERLTAYLPVHFRTDVTYRLTDNDTSIPNSVTMGEENLSDRSRDLQLDVVHRLYKSLDTTYTFLDTSRESSGGDTDSRWNTLNLSYAKLISDGRALAGVTVARGETIGRGSTDVVNEPHAGILAPGSTFTLVHPNVDSGSVVLYLKSPLPPFQNVLLTETLHYVLTPVADRLEVFVQSLPAPFGPGTYDFFASYALLAGTFDLETDSFGFNTSVELFNTMLIPYYSYVTIQSEVVSGLFPGTPVDSTSNTLGVRYQRGAWRARGEYQDLDWNVSPYRAWRGDLQYVGAISPTASLYGTAAYVNKYYPEGSSLQFNEAYTDETASASGNVRKEIREHGLVLSAGGSLSRTSGLVDSNTYMLNGLLTWQVGRLSLTAGANVYRYDAEGTTLVETGRTHHYYYLTLRRVMF